MTAVALLNDYREARDLVRTWHEYLRVSKDKSGREKSQGEQSEENTAHRARERGIAGRTYRDTGGASRTSRAKRGDFQQLMADLENPRMFPAGDVLQMWESSRGTRREGEWATLLDLAADRQILIYVTTHNRMYDPTNPRDRRTLMEDAVDAAYETGKLSKRVTRSMTANADAGLPHAITPYGYIREYNPRTRALIAQRIREPYAEIVRGIFARFAAGVSLRAIVEELNDAGVPTVYQIRLMDAIAAGDPDGVTERVKATGQRWRPTTVRNILTRPAYIGKRSHYGRLVDAVWPAIVRPEVFYTVQSRLADPKRKAGKAGRPGAAKHFCSMWSRCVVCSGLIAAGYRSGRRVYKCNDKSHVMVNADAMDAYVTVRVQAALSDPELWQRFAAAADDTDETVLAARDAVGAATARLSELHTMAGDGRISLSSFAHIEPGIIAEIDAAQRIIDGAGVAAPEVKALLRYPIAERASRWAAMELSAQRAVADHFVTVRVLPNPAGYAGLRKAPIDQRVLVTLKSAA